MVSAALLAAAAAEAEGYELLEVQLTHDGRAGIILSDGAKGREAICKNKCSDGCSRSWLIQQEEGRGPAPQPKRTS